jgi:hypothetical protein
LLFFRVVLPVREFHRPNLRSIRNFI